MTGFQKKTKTNHPRYWPFRMNELTILSHFKTTRGGLVFQPDFLQLAAITELLNKNNCQSYSSWRKSQGLGPLDEKLAAQLEAVLFRHARKAGNQPARQTGGETTGRRHYPCLLSSWTAWGSLAEWLKETAGCIGQNRFWWERSTGCSGTSQKI